MLPKYHILLGGIFALILYFFFSVSAINAWIVFLSSVLIDFDHYLYYFFREKEFSVKKAYEKYLALDGIYFSLPDKKKKISRYGFCIFHGVEVVFLIFLIGYFLEKSFLIFIALGFLFHIFLDTSLRIYEDGNPLEISSLIGKLVNDIGKEDIWDYSKS